MGKNAKFTLFMTTALLLLGIPIAIFITIGLLKLFIYIYPWKPLFFIDTQGFVFEIKDIVYFSMALIGVVATGIFSYFIWKANRKSAVIAGKLAKLEENRDITTFKESANLLYFTALSAVEYIFQTHTGNRNTRLPYLTDKWLDQLSHLVNIFDPEDIKILFDMFNEFNVIDKQKNNIPVFIKTYFDDSCIEYTSLVSAEFDNPIRLLKTKYKNIYDKLFLLIHYGNTSKFVEVSKSTETYRDGKRFCEFEFLDGFISHKRFWDINGNLLEDCSYQNDKATGYKKIYKGRCLMFEGQIVNNEMFTGKEFNLLVRDSQGYDLFGEEAWEEKQIEEQNSDSYSEKQLEDYIYMSEHAQIWNEYTSANWLDGNRDILKNEIHREPIDI